MPFKKGHPCYLKNHTDETKKKIAKASTGRIHTKETKDKLSKLNTGIKQSAETIAKKVKTRLDRGYKHSKETKKKIGLGNKGKVHTEEQNQANRERMLNNPIKKFKDTSIELKMEAELKESDINYQKQVPLCKIAVVDFYLPEYKIIIQCDGDYWHNLPGRQDRDRKQDLVLTSNGFNVYRFWEHEINESVSECLKSIKIIWINN